MKKLIFITLLLISNGSYANWFKDVIDAVNKQGLITNNWLSSINAQQKELLESQHAVESVVKQMNAHFTGHSGWGAYQFHDYQSYGDSARDWRSVMQMAGKGQGEGALGAVIKELAHQFPAETMQFNRSVNNHMQQDYYTLQSQTVLATRAASQLDYNKIQEQIAYQQMLQQQIEKANDLKSAMDLSNRIQVEGNLINLEILRQAALANQQQSLTQQASLNSALANAKFLTK